MRFAGDNFARSGILRKPRIQKVNLEYGCKLNKYNHLFATKAENQCRDPGGVDRP